MSRALPLASPGTCGDCGRSVSLVAVDSLAGFATAEAMAGKGVA